MKSLKKVFLFIILIVIVAIIAFIAINASSGKKEQKVANVSSDGRIGDNGNVTNANSVETNSQNTANEAVSTNKNITKKLAVTKETTSTGTLYKVSDKKINPEIVLKDKYYDTTIADINTNFKQYEGKNIQIEGMYFETKPYTFVGKYSTSNLCPTCPQGISYFEYEWPGDETPSLKQEDSWIKVIGTLKKGNDGQEYYYIDVNSIEVLNKKGNDTVNN